MPAALREPAREDSTGFRVPLTDQSGNWNVTSYSLMRENVLVNINHMIIPVTDGFG